MFQPISSAPVGYTFFGAFDLQPSGANRGRPTQIQVDVYIRNERAGAARSTCTNRVAGHLGPSRGQTISTPEAKGPTAW